MLAWRNVNAEVVHVRRNEAVLHADLPAVQPDASLPVDPFQEEFHAFALPAGRDLDIALVPGRPGVDVWAIEAVERGFGLIGQAEFCFIRRSGQVDFMRKPRGIPLLFDAGVFGIEPEPPRAGQGNRPDVGICHRPS